MAQGGSNKKVANSLVAVSAAAVLAVYAAGYERTRSAAEQFDAQAAERRPIAPSAVVEPPRPAAAAITETPAPVAPVPARPAPVPGRAVTASLERARLTKHAPTPEPVPMPERVPTAVSLRDDAAAAPAAPTPVVQPAAPAVTPAAPVASVASVNSAAAPVPAASAPVVSTSNAPAAKWKDGTFNGWGTCRHGDIQAEVVIQGGRIQSATIAQCLTRYSCNVIGRLPPQVVQRQSAEVDFVSGATESADAFYYAVFDALSKAK